MSRWGTWAPVVSALAVAGLVVGVSVALDGGSDGPPALRLAAGAGTTTDASAAESRSSGVRFTGTLPTGPETARVHDLPDGAAPVNRVRELATALGVTASPQRVVRAWRAGPLVVRDEPGHPWTLGTDADCGPDSAVSSDGTTTCVAPDQGSGAGSSGSVGSGCAQPEPYPTPAPPAGCPAPGPADEPRDTPATLTSGRAVPPALTCARTVPTGSPPPCPTSPATVCRAGSTSCAEADGAVTCPAAARCASDGPTVPADCASTDGRSSCDAPLAMTAQQALDATQRLRTSLGLEDADVTAQPSPAGATVVADPRVEGRRTQGIATALTIGADRALVSAAGWLADSRAGAAYPLISASQALERLAPAPALGAPCDAKGGCPQPAVTTLPSVELGLQLTALQGSEAALVPTWLFAQSGGGVLAVLAVQDAYVTEPTDRPGSVEPAPGRSDPAGTEPGQTTPAPARSPLPFDGAVLVDGSLSVRYGSVCVAGVTAEVKEGPDSVTVSLQQDAPPPDQACIDLYKATFVPIALREPLGSRRVLDAATGRDVAVVTCPSDTEMCPE